MKFPTYLTLAVLAAQGCGAGLNGSNSNEREIYKSPTLPESYGMKIINCNGDVGNGDPYLKDGKLWIVGYSHAHASEKGASNDTQTNATETLLDLIDEDEMFISGMRSRKAKRCKVLSKKGKTGYVKETLYSVPLDNLSKKAQQRIKRYIK